VRELVTERGRENESVIASIPRDMLLPPAVCAMGHRAENEIVIAIASETAIDTWNGSATMTAIVIVTVIQIAIVVQTIVIMVAAPLLAIIDIEVEAAVTVAAGASAVIAARASPVIPAAIRSREPLSYHPCHHPHEWTNLTLPPRNHQHHRSRPRLRHPPSHSNSIDHHRPHLLCQPPILHPMRPLSLLQPLRLVLAL